MASALVLTELPRAFARRVPDADQEGVRALVLRIDVVDLDRAVLSQAGQLPDAQLRSLDAVHLASALRVREVVDRFVAYDQRLLDAAHRAGLEVASPA